MLPLSEPYTLGTRPDNEGEGGFEQDPLRLVHPVLNVLCDTLHYPRWGSGLIFVDEIAGLEHLQSVEMPSL